MRRGSAERGNRMRQPDEALLTEMTAYIKRYAHENNGQTPGMYEIAAALHIEKTRAYRYLKLLNERGAVEYTGKGTLKFSGGDYVRECRFVKVPIYGSVICGTPAEEEQYNEGYLALPEEWTQGEDCFLLRARGDSMKDIGVEEGDFVLVRRSDGADDGQVVVALTEEGNTLKRYRENGGRPVLWAENRDWSKEQRTIVPKTLTVQGIAMKVIKNIV